MSRVAKSPVILPANVQLSLTDNTMTVKGPKGELSVSYHKSVLISQNDNIVKFEPIEGQPKGWQHAGTARANLANLSEGVSNTFTKSLEMVGVGYRGQLNGKVLDLSLGFSHPVKHTLPDNVTAEMPNNTTIVLRSSDKQLLGQEAARIRAYRPPEPYKGKGIRYAGEKILRKEAKKK